METDIMEEPLGNMSNIIHIGELNHHMFQEIKAKLNY